MGPAETDPPAGLPSPSGAAAGLRTPRDGNGGAWGKAALAAGAGEGAEVEAGSGAVAVAAEAGRKLGSACHATCDRQKV